METKELHLPEPTTEAEALAILDQSASAEFVDNVFDDNAQVDISKAALVALHLAFTNPDRAHRLFNGLVDSMTLARKIAGMDEANETPIRVLVEEKVDDFVRHWERHESRGVMAEAKRTVAKVNAGIDRSLAQREQIEQLMANLPQALAGGQVAFATQGPDGTLRPLGRHESPFALPQAKGDDDDKPKVN